MGLSIEQSTPLLVEEEDQDELINRKKADLRWRIANIILFVYSVLMTTVVVYLQTQTHKSHIPYSAARHLLQTSNVVAHMDGKSILSSSPSLEMHTAWRDLLVPSYIYATKEEIKLSGGDPRNTVKLADGNYLAVFGVYHQLHCMRWLFYLTHEEIYWSNMTSAQRDIRREHGKHCIQTLIDYLMCKPDTALYPIALDPSSENALQLMSGAEWQCVNWNSVHGWAMDRNQGYTPDIVAPDSYLDDLRS